jgi:hypothetical protein
MSLRQQQEELAKQQMQLQNLEAQLRAQSLSAGSFGAGGGRVRELEVENEYLKQQVWDPPFPCMHMQRRRCIRNSVTDAKCSMPGTKC